VKTVIWMSCAAGVMLISAACQTFTKGYDKPARIINPDDASRAALQETVDSAFGTRVTLADNALTDSSLLIVERSPRPTMENPNPLGRNMETPFQLRLYANGPDCVLVDQRDRSRYVLANTNCEAE
jgi:hypothetical protein